MAILLYCWRSIVTRSLSRKQSAALGFVVIACLAVGVWGLFRVAGKSGMWRDGYELVVVANDAQDVEPGTPVRVRGIEAGRVTAVEYAGDEVHIHLMLDGKLRDHLYADATAGVQTKGILGVSVVDIKPGTPKAGPLTEPFIASKPTPDLAQVTAKLDSVATRVDAVLKDVQDGKGTLPKLLKDDDIYNDLKSASTDAKKLVKNLDETTTALRGDTQATLKKVNSSVDAIHGELDGMKTFVRSGQEAVTAIKQDAEAVKALPIVRSYVEDNVALLVRPDCEKDRVVYTPEMFFETNTSILTSEGRTRLEECAGWLNGQHQKKSEVVVASFIDPKSPDLTAPGAKTLSKKQAEVIAEYLKERGVHKMGYVTRRNVTPVGHGFDPSPVVEKEALPVTRIEVILFIPRS
jgi:phospholipid/cholesterol/gamma-HCH transport system substrate-binding protein